MNSPISDTGLKHWLVVDRVRVPQAPRVVYHEESHPEMTLLFACKQFEHLLEHSPALFRVEANTPLVEYMLKQADWRTSSMIFSTPAAVSADQLLEHLRNLLIVKVEGRKQLFRFYSTVFLSRTCDRLEPEDIAVLLGPATAISWVNAELKLQYLQRASDGELFTDIAYVLSSTFSKQERA